MYDIYMRTKGENKNNVFVPEKYSNIHIIDKRVITTLILTNKNNLMVHTFLIINIIYYTKYDK